MNEISSDKYNFSLDSTLPYYLVLVFYGIFYVGVYIHNQFLTIVFIYVVLPLLDSIISVDIVNPSKEKEKELKKNLSFKIPLYIAICFDVFTYCFGIYHLLDENYNLLYKASCIFVLMTFQAISNNYAHELMHKVNKIENIVSALLLVKNYYIHWFIEHNYGHHKHVGTPLDPASAVKGETVYEFMPKSFIGQIYSSLEIEKKFVEESKRSSLSNRIYWSYITYFLYAFTFYKIFGFKVMATSIMVGLGGPIYLEIINYLEHYGLRREKLQNGEYENVTVHHSWNTPHRITNYLLFKLQRHSDHHANALKPYQTLCSYDESPNLPSGYAFCVLLAMFPSKWFEIIDPLVDEYSKNKKISEKTMKIADEKTKEFNKSAGFYFISLFLLQIVVNYIL